MKILSITLLMIILTLTGCYNTDSCEYKEGDKVVFELDNDITGIVTFVRPNCTVWVDYFDKEGRHHDDVFYTYEIKPAKN